MTGKLGRKLSIFSRSGETFVEWADGSSGGHLAQGTIGMVADSLARAARRRGAGVYRRILGRVHRPARRLAGEHQSDHQRCPRRACFPDLGHYRRANGAEETVLRLQDRSDGALEFDMTKLSKEL